MYTKLDKLYRLISFSSSLIVQKIVQKNDSFQPSRVELTSLSATFTLQGIEVGGPEYQEKLRQILQIYLQFCAGELFGKIYQQKEKMINVQFMLMGHSFHS